ncbi:MAG: leucine-rich repeat domain-containing protein [Syntrophomonadaceae bacterium]|jgi:hypothetical protein|nr:leucine-rich repeat domain-containing protein [Syntrophomonadaceae bacterium]
MKRKLTVLIMLVVSAGLLLTACGGGTSAGGGGGNQSGVNANAGGSGDRSGASAPPANTAPRPDYITIQGVQYSTDLTELNLRNAGLTAADIEPLRYMTNLETLDLSENNISDLSVLAGLSNLGRLDLRNNKISDLRALAGLSNLTELHLDGNNISDWLPVAHVKYVDGRPDANRPSASTPAPAPPTTISSNVFTDSFTGPLSANWTTSGSVQSLGERGLLLRGSGEFIKNLVVSSDILPEDCWDYTVEFELNVPGDMKSSWVFVLLSERLNIAENKYVAKDYIALDNVKSYIWDVDVNENTSSDTVYKYDTYHKIRVDVTGKKADLFMDGVYLTSRALGGDRSTLAFKTDESSSFGYIIRNFELTVK